MQRVVNIPTNVHMVELERAWEEEGYLYLQMELLSKSLTQEIEDGHYLTENEVGIYTWRQISLFLVIYEWIKMMINLARVLNVMNDFYSYLLIFNVFKVWR